MLLKKLKLAQKRAAFAALFAPLCTVEYLHYILPHTRCKREIN
jgi:hypothetical protein